MLTPEAEPPMNSIYAPIGTPVDGSSAKNIHEMLANLKTDWVIQYADIT